jgi:hypothetical protein
VAASYSMKKTRLDEHVSAVCDDGGVVEACGGQR